MGESGVYRLSSISPTSLGSLDSSGPPVWDKGGATMVLCPQASYHSDRWRPQEPEMPCRAFHQKAERSREHVAGRQMQAPWKNDGSRARTVWVRQSCGVEHPETAASRPMLGAEGRLSEGPPAQPRVSASPASLPAGCPCSLSRRSTSPCRPSPSRRAAGRPCPRGTPSPRSREGPGERQAVGGGGWLGTRVGWGGRPGPAWQDPAETRRGRETE